MRIRTALAAAVVMNIGTAGAADIPADVFAAPASTGFVSEFRIGAFAHDPWSPERGSGDVNAELLFARPTLAVDPLWSLFVPRPHVGATVNSKGDTSHVYAGFTWTFDVSPRLFVEGALGGSFNNGTAGPVTPVGRSALGCHTAFRESASLGYRITREVSVLATVEHMSNAGLCSDNRGLTNVGLRLGYTF